VLSQTAEYALRAVLHIAEEGRDRPLRVEEVADVLRVPRNYLSKILHVLAREGILRSSRGPQGGFRLAVPAGELPLERVVAPFDRILERDRCLLGRPSCSDVRPCAAHDRWRDVAGSVRDFFRVTTIGELSLGGARAARGPARRAVAVPDRRGRKAGARRASGDGPPRGRSRSRSRAGNRPSVKRPALLKGGLR
jgi:Rrf2 family protein